MWPRMNRLLKSFSALFRHLSCMAGIWLTAGIFPVFAQETGSAPPVPAPTFTRPLYLEWGITGAVIALAIFVVCRKSNRT